MTWYGTRTARIGIQWKLRPNQNVARAAWRRLLIRAGPTLTTAVVIAARKLRWKRRGVKRYLLAFDPWPSTSRGHAPSCSRPVGPPSWLTAWCGMTACRLGQSWRWARDLV